ncbi:MAG TPA: alpha-amylase family glycosyl hydrolase [Burkholderiaceae bacterium]|nr:alpha-amylase family glycosyl hydrolase [Burkholderiaceae bacterium]
MLSHVIGRFRRELHAAGDAEDRSRQVRHLQALELRAHAQLPKLSAHLEALYGGRRDLPAQLGTLLELAITKGLERPDELRQLDAAREHDPSWFSSHKRIGAALYVDRHCGTLGKLEQEISYLKLLNVSMLHLMPTVYKTPEKNNDGGYAISDFRSVNPAIGTMEELRDLFATFRKNGISPVMDVTVNHVADEHAWARAAQAGDTEKRGYFFALDAAGRDAYEPHLGRVFPDIRRSNFTWNDDTGRYMWTSFMSSQWDLNYANPATLAAMAGEQLFLLNQGAEVLRMDAVPWLWKELGTDCKYRPQVQAILGTFNALCRIAAPGTVLLAEAIHEPERIKRNLGTDRCPMAYNTITLAHLWDALAHADASFMAEVLKRHGNTAPGTSFLNMVRTHDEMGFYFDKESAAALGIDLDTRRRGLGEFYGGGGTHAKAQAFLANNNSTHMLLTGTTGSLAGLEKAIEAGDPQQMDAAVRRIRLLNSVLLGLPGVPMLNLMGGDDRGQVNDYSYQADETLRTDSRWVNRVQRDVDFKAKSPLEIEAMDRVFSDTVDLNRVRARDMPAFDAGPMQVIDTGKAPVLAFARQNGQQEVVVLANFSPSPQKVDPQHLRAHGLTEAAIDKIGANEGQVQSVVAGVELAPYQCMWLVPADRELDRSRILQTDPA